MTTAESPPENLTLQQIVRATERLSAEDRAILRRHLDEAKEVESRGQETRLLHFIEASVLSDADLKRLEHLNARVGKSDLTTDEHAELLQLVTRSQQLDAERLNAVADLAELRGVSPRQLIAEMGLSPSVR